MPQLLRHLETEMFTFTRGSTGTYFNKAGLLVTAALDEIRRDFDPVTKARRGYLLEPNRTNMFLRSQEFDQAPWSASGTTVDPNVATVAPDGTATADRLREDGTTGVHQISQNVSVNAALDHAMSLFVKADGRSQIEFTNTFPGGSASLTANLTTSTVLSGDGGCIDVGSGWRYIWQNFTSVTAGGGSFRIRLSDGASASYVGNNASGVLLWGAQLEEGGGPSSYIATGASAATRAADLAEAALGDWFNMAEFTLFLEADYNGGSALKPGNRIAFQIGSGTDRIFFNNSGGARGAAVVRVSGVDQVSLSGAVAGQGLFRAAFSCKENDFALSVNGGAVVTDTVGQIPAGMTLLRLGTQGGTLAMNGHVRRAFIYPTRKSNADLIAMTA